MERIRNYVRWDSSREIYAIFIFSFTPMIVRGDLATLMIFIYAVLIVYAVLRFSSCTISSNQEGIRR